VAEIGPTLSATRLLVQIPPPAPIIITSRITGFRVWCEGFTPFLPLMTQGTVAEIGVDPLIAGLLREMIE